MIETLVEFKKHDKGEKSESSKVRYKGKAVKMREIVIESGQAPRVAKASSHQVNGRPTRMPKRTESRPLASYARVPTVCAIVHQKPS